jgi:hypothetical protein
LFFAHCCVSFQDLSYLVLRYVLAAVRRYKTKKPQELPCDPLRIPKAIQEQQTQQNSTTIHVGNASKIVSVLQ